MGEPRYRVGRSIGRTIYDGDTPIGMLDTPEYAAAAVDGMNEIDATAGELLHRTIPCMTNDGAFVVFELRMVPAGIDRPGRQ